MNKFNLAGIGVLGSGDIARKRYFSNLRELVTTGRPPLRFAFSRRIHAGTTAKKPGPISVRQSAFRFCDVFRRFGLTGTVDA